MEVKIQIPDNCELIKDGDTYIVKEKILPRSWEEFCKNYPINNNEFFIDDCSRIEQVCGSNNPRDIEWDRNICTSKEEVEAFLALMQLRQLRKAWVGDWKVSRMKSYGVIYPDCDGLTVGVNTSSRRVLSFPTKEMAQDFLNCFRDLCETAKILL